VPPGWEPLAEHAGRWHIDGHHALELSPLDRTRDDRIRWRYRLTYKGRAVFTGSDLTSGTGDKLCTDAYGNAAVALVNFITAGSGGSEVYTRPQRAWHEQHAEEIEIYAGTDLCGYCGQTDHLSACCPHR
jgi:hypothetical protein